MPKFCANLTMMFNEVPFLERFAAAANAGFRAVEFMFPYEFAAADIAARLKENNLQLILFNSNPGDWNKGDRGTACKPDRMKEFRDGIGVALEYASALNCQKIHCMAGKPEDVPLNEAWETYFENLRFAAAQAAKKNVNLLIEPLSTQEMPGYLYANSTEAVRVLDTAKLPNVLLQYDIYHMQRVEGEIANTIAKLLPRIGHIQIADNPGRNEPGTGEINYPFLFRHLDAIGYEGWVGCEYRPLRTTMEGLSWLKQAKA